MGVITSFTVRRASARDREGILLCLRAAFGEFASQYTDGAFAATVLTPESLANRLSTMMVWVAAIGDEIIGTVTAAIADKAEGHLRGMAVDPRFQKRGVAGELLNAAIAELRGRGCQRVTLNTTDPLAAAIRFYESNGFRATGRSSDFFGMTLREYARAL